MLFSPIVFYYETKKPLFETSNSGFSKE